MPRLLLRSTPPTPRGLLLLLLLAWTAAATACVPIPHSQREAPALRGVLHQQGRPAAGVRVTLAVNPRGAAEQTCAGGVATKTDAAGRFVFAETSYFSPVIVFGDRRDSWALCFDAPEGRRVVWSDSAWWGGPAFQDLACDLGRVGGDLAPEGAEPPRPGCRVTTAPR